MSDVASHLAFLRDPRLAALATSAAPAWLWSTDATRILWANPVGAAIFGLATPAALPSRRFDARDQTAAQIARLLGTLRLGGAARLERLRGFGTGFWRALLCTCSRVTLPDHTAGVLVVAAEPAGPALTLTERVRRLYEGSGLAIAAFAPDGSLIHATPEGRARLSDHASLAALGAERIGEDAIALGRATGEISLGRVTVDRLGADATTVLAATFAAERATAPLQPHVAPPAPPVVAPAATAPSPAPTPPVVPPVVSPVVAEPPPAPEPPPHEVVAPPTVPATPAVPEAPPVVPEMPDAAADQPARPAVPEAQEAPPEPPQDTKTAAPDAPRDKPVPPLRIDVPIPERRHPLRFVWQMDASGRFTLGSDEFTEVIGPRIAIALGRPWAEINDELALDPEGQVARAVATRDTWSGITVSWPVDGSADRLKVELSGLPIYDRNRTFLGYRGFGVCRDIDRIATLAVMRRATFAGTPPPPASAPAEAAAAPAEAAAAPDTSADARPALTLVPTARNVLPFRSASPAPEPKSPGLSPVERNAFHELARQLTARLKGDAEHGAPDQAAEPTAEPAPEAAAGQPAESIAAAMPAAEPAPAPTDEASAAPPAPSEAEQAVAPTAAESVAETIAAAAPGVVTAAEAATEPAPAEQTITAHAAAEHAGAEPVAVEPFAIEAPPHEPIERPLLDRIPVGVLVYRLDTLLYANRAFLEWTGYDHLDAFAEAGGLDSLFVEGGGADVDEADAGKTLAIATPRGDKLPVNGRLFSIPWDGDSALVLMLVTTAADDRLKATESALGLAEAQGRELKTILDTATDGVVVIEPDGRIVSANRSAEALFGYDTAELTARNFADLFAPASRAAALGYLASLGHGGVGGLINDGREFTGEVRQGGAIPLVVTLGRIADDSERVCAVFRDISPWKKAEKDLVAARQEAERASDAKSDFLAKVSHEIRTPLNSIIGFSEVMLEERFGPIGNERYRDYLRDIRTSGDHVVALLNDLLDLSKIEAGKLDLSFANLSLNEVVQGCVTLMQPQANRERIIIRTSLSPTLGPVLADAKSVRQIVLNLLSNSIKFTGAGGQVIVSTAQSAAGEAVLRVRDTGIGMDDKELGVALEPFRQLATAARWGSAGTGLGLPLTKALAEANRARFTITSKINDGTLVEVAFPATRVLAE